MLIVANALYPSGEPDSTNYPATFFITLHIFIVGVDRDVSYAR